MRNTLVPRFIVAVIVVSVALGLIFNQVEAADPEVVSTWKGGMHFLPASATRSGDFENVSFKGEPLEQWAQRLTREVVKPDAKIPAVIYSHGCKGPLAASDWAATFNEFGFAFFAPDSFRRPGRVALCYSPGDMLLARRSALEVFDAPRRNQVRPSTNQQAGLDRSEPNCLGRS